MLSNRFGQDFYIYDLGSQKIMAFSIGFQVEAENVSSLFKANLPEPMFSVP